MKPEGRGGKKRPGLVLSAAGGALQKLGPCRSPEEDPCVHPLELCLCEQPVNLQWGFCGSSVITRVESLISGTSQATKNFPGRSAAPGPTHFPTTLQCSVLTVFSILLSFTPLLETKHPPCQCGVPDSGTVRSCDSSSPQRGWFPAHLLDTDDS